MDILWIIYGYSVDDNMDMVDIPSGQFSHNYGMWFGTFGLGVFKVVKPRLA